MIFIYKCIILVWMIKFLSCAEYSNCPSFYQLSDGSFQTKMEFPIPSNDTNMINFQIQLSMGSNGNFEPEFDNNLLFHGTTEDNIKKQTLIFTLDLPPYWNNYNSKITTIMINDEKLCLSDRVDEKKFEIVTVVNRIARLKIVTYTSNNSDNANPSSTLPPETNLNIKNTFETNYYMTQSPKILNDTDTPIRTQRFKRDFQNNNCYNNNSTLSTAFADNTKNIRYPWIGALVLKKGQHPEFLCGATLITEKLALTAAHCITYTSRKENSLPYLIFGTSDLDVFNDDSQFAKVIRSSIHPEYKSDTADADIAILEMSRELYITFTVKPICLCNDEECFTQIDDQIGVVAGWERTKLSKTIQPILTRITSEEQCLRSSPLFYDITSNRTFCAGDKNNEEFCKIASGSGLHMIFQGRWIIKGIVSRALHKDGICDWSQYIVFVDVVKHLEWIKQYLYLKYIGERSPTPESGMALKEQEYLK